VSLYALLASRRFERPWVAGVAGVLSGLALLTKETSVIFLGAPAIVAVLRGGWRRPLGLLAFAAGLGVVAGPWYAYHLHDLTSTANSIGGLAPSPLQAPPRWSLQNLGWYFWDLVNEQVMAPLALAFVIGVVFAVRQCLRRPLAAENVLPELLAGALVSYLGMTYLTHKDPRYTLPMLVYVAVLATGWIAAIARPRLRTALTAAVVALAAINAFGVSTGIGGPVRIALPGAKNTIIFQRQLTLYANVGWIRGGPQRDGDAQALVRGLYKAGIRKVEFDPSVNALDFNSQGLVFLAAAAGMVSPPTFVNEPDNAFVIRRAVRRGDPPPCQRLNDGSGIYVIQGNAGGINPRKLRNPANPRQRFTLLCPGRGRVLFP
jgi:4-amino-4-deoxy-L-arabinose transferase-like glycosyltransferase